MTSLFSKLYIAQRPNFWGHRGCYSSSLLLPDYLVLSDKMINSNVIQGFDQQTPAVQSSENVNAMMHIV